MSECRNLENVGQVEELLLTGEAPCPVQPFSESSDSTEQVKKSNCSGYQPPFAAKKTVQISLHRFRLLVSVL